MDDDALHQTVEVIRCPNCDALHFVADLDFPDPEEDANTQFGWLVAQCPSCKGDVKVGFDKLPF